MVPVSLFSVVAGSTCTGKVSRGRFAARVRELVADRARLRTAPEVILEAVRERAWLPEQIEGVSSKYTLESHPPPLEGFEPWMDWKPKIRRAA